MIDQTDTTLAAAEDDISKIAAFMAKYRGVLAGAAWHIGVYQNRAEITLDRSWYRGKWVRVGEIASLFPEAHWYRRKSIFTDCADWIALIDNVPVVIERAEAARPVVVHKIETAEPVPQSLLAAKRQI